MQKFSPNEFSIRDAKGVPVERTDGPESRIVKTDLPAKTTVQGFDFPKLDGKSFHGYSEAKKKYGALAITDPEQAGKAQKDRRFSLNPLLRGPLSVEEEEQRVIDQRVSDRVAAVSEAAHKAASELGYQEGLEKGYQESFARFQQEARERMAAFEGLIAEFEGAKTDVFRANERFVVELVFRIARMLMLKELSTDPEYVLRLARELIERVGVRENIRIRINPAEAQSIGLLKEGLEKSLGTLKNLNIEASNSVKRGGCVLETEWNAIDASIDTQLQGVYDALVGKSASGSEAPEGNGA